MNVAKHAGHAANTNGPDGRKNALPYAAYTLAGMKPERKNMAELGCRHSRKVR